MIYAIAFAAFLCLVGGLLIAQAERGEPREVAGLLLAIISFLPFAASLVAIARL